MNSFNEAGEVTDIQEIKRADTSEIELKDGMSKKEWEQNYDRLQAEIGGKPVDSAETLDSLKATFSKDNWDNLSEGQRLDACIELRDYIKDDLGLESGLNMEFVEDMDKDVAGTNEATDYAGNKIEINMNDLDDPEKMVDTISHECYHTYQHEQADNVDSLPENDEEKYRAEQWKEDFDEQTGDAQEDYNLSVEQDARKYAANIGDRIFS